MDRAQDRQRLALIEVLEREGQPARLVDVHAWPVTLGRALDNDIVLDDPHVAAHHAQLTLGEDGCITLSVLDTRNGVLRQGRRVDASRPLPLAAAGAVLQLGTTRVKLRLPGEVLAPEEALPHQGRSAMAAPLLAGGALLALEFGGHALSVDPGSDFAAWLPTLVGLPLALAAWCGFWALLSKVFQHRFDFMGHVRIALPWMLGIGALGLLWPQLAAALALPTVWKLTPMLQAVGGVLLVHAHLRHALPAHPRAVSAAVAGCALLGAGISVTLTQRANDSVFSTPYMSTLPMPALRLSASVPAAVLVQDMGPLAAALAQRAQRARDEDGDEGSTGAEE